MLYKKHHEINLYVRPESKLCELAKGYFKDINQDFNEYDVVHDQDAFDRMFNLTEQTNTPVAEIDGRIIVDYRPDLYDLIFDNKISRKRKDDKKDDDNDDSITSE